MPVSSTPVMHAFGISVFGTAKRKRNVHGSVSGSDSDEGPKSRRSDRLRRLQSVKSTQSTNAESSASRKDPNIRATPSQLDEPGLESSRGKVRMGKNVRDGDEQEQSDIGTHGESQQTRLVEVVEISSDDDSGGHDDAGKGSSNASSQAAKLTTGNNVDPSTGSRKSKVMTTCTLSHEACLAALASHIPRKYFRGGQPEEENVRVAAQNYVEQLQGRPLPPGRPSMHVRDNLKYRMMENFEAHCNFRTKALGVIRLSPANDVLLIKHLFDFFHQHRNPAPAHRHLKQEERGNSSKIGTTPAAIVPHGQKQDNTIASGLIGSTDSSHEQATSYIRELSISAPSARLARKLALDPGKHYIKDQPITKASAAQWNADLAKAVSTNARTPGVTSDTTDAGVKKLLARHDKESTSIVANPRIELPGGFGASLKPFDQAGEPMQGSPGSKQSVVENSMAASSSQVIDDSVAELRAQIKTAKEQMIDWRDIWLALLESELALKRVQQALEKAKNAVAQHGEAMNMN